MFPWGTNHLSGVEVVSYDQVWATPFDTNAVASAGAPFEIVHGLTTFAYEFTPSNSYRFAWTDAALWDLTTAPCEAVSRSVNKIALRLQRTLMRGSFAALPIWRGRRAWTCCSAA